MKFYATAAVLFVAVPALVSSAPTGPQDLEKRQSFTNSVTYDDQSNQAVYYGEWTHLQNQGFKLLDKTESYTGQANA